MTKEIENLWPKTTGTTKIIAPVEILRKQSQYLSESSNNIVIGEVKSGPGVYTEDLFHTFYVVSPSLGNYRFKLLTISHGLLIYPVEVTNEIEGGVTKTVYNEGELLTALKAIFSSEKVQYAINAMIGQS